jgi:pimeloyl-ACP methyl ester carboxylesterase
MPYIEVNNARLYYEDYGEGNETIVFGHGMLFNLRMFDEQVAALKSNYRCVLFDFRGQGKSEVSSDGYDMDNLAVDVSSLIKELKCDPCHFVGFSMGGIVAMRIAYRYPELIKSLLLIDTSSEPEPDAGQFRYKMMLWVARNIGLKPIANKVISILFRPAFLKDPERKALRSIWKKHFLSNSRTGIVRAVQGVFARPGITDMLPKIEVPTLILWGDQDDLSDREKAEIMNKNILNSELKIIPRAGHMSPIEEPAKVNELIIEFLNNLH